MATRYDDRSSGGLEPADNSVEGVVELVKSYARQETIEPIKRAGRFLAYGSAGALLVGSGGALILLGLLRLLQTEVDRTARGALSWLAYAIVLVVCAAGMALALSRIGKGRWDAEGER